MANDHGEEAEGRRESEEGKKRQEKERMEGKKKN
jgi:hypothetical protein